MRASSEPATPPAALSYAPALSQAPAERVRLALALGALCVLFTFLAATDLANVRPVSGDDALILTVSAHLVETGTLGSPLHDGIHGADRHYFLNLPLQHLLHAVTFRLFGEGVPQARAVSVLAALVLLCASTVVARLWLGVRVALITGLLLVVWRSGLIGLDYGIPLLAVARTARYDVTAVALLWLALLAFDAQLRRPRRALALLTGVLAGLAMLTQFHGALVLPALIALWLARGGDARDVRAAGLAWVMCGLVLTLAPYVAWFAAHASDALAQLRFVHGERAPGGITNILRSAVSEPLRFSAALRQRGIGQAGLLVAMIAALLLVRRAPAALRTAGQNKARSAPPQGTSVPQMRALRDDLRAPVFVGVAMLAGLALFEPTKAPLYALPLLPVFCMLLAAAIDALLAYRRRSTNLRAPVATATAVVIALALLAEGVVALGSDRAAAARATNYASLAADMEDTMEPGARVLGPAQWSWGLRVHPYDETRATALRFTVLEADGTLSLEAMLRERNVRYILLNEDVGNDLLRGFYRPEFSLELSRLIASCTTQLRVWNDPTYGVLELRTLEPACSGD